MLPTQRRQAILAQVRKHSAVSADDLAREFGVSVETIRRDLRRLGDKGLLDRVYGGATRPAGRSSAVVPTSMITVSPGSTNVAASRAMARLAVIRRTLRAAKLPSLDRPVGRVAPPYTRSSRPLSPSLRRSRRIVSTDTPNSRARSSAETALWRRTCATIAWRR